MIKQEEKRKVKLLKPKIDVVFHALFREDNKYLTEAFVSAILDEKVKIKSTNLDRHLRMKGANEKLGIMDLRTELEDGTKCNIEIQLLKRDFEIERFLYYWSNTYSRQLYRKDDYSKLCKTISIVILDHELEDTKGIDQLLDGK